MVTFTLPYELLTYRNQRLVFSIFFDCVVSTLKDFGLRPKNLAKVFRARFLIALNEAGFSIPYGVPKKWVVDYTRAGEGISAIKYLSGYLYRGVISEKNIIANCNGMVTFKYEESKTGATKFRTLKGRGGLFASDHAACPPQKGLWISP